MYRNYLLVFTFLVSFITGGYLLFNKNNLNSQLNNSYHKVQEDDIVKGNLKAKVTIIKYTDLQCPACKDANKVLKLQWNNFKDKVKLVVRHFPLKRHLYAKDMAIYLEAANKQGKFWELYDKIFEEQDRFATISSKEKAQDLLEIIVKKIDLDFNEFSKDLQDKSIVEKVNRDVKLGKDLNIPGTPTLFLNGKIVQNYNNIYQEIQKEIDYL